MRALSAPLGHAGPAAGHGRNRLRRAPAAETSVWVASNRFGAAVACSEPTQCTQTIARKGSAQEHDADDIVGAARREVRRTSHPSSR